MSNGGWPQAVAHEIGLPHPLRFKSMDGGSLAVFLECSTCTKEIEWMIPKRFPPEIFRKKMGQMGWDTRKRRCPTCKTSGRKTAIRSREPDTIPITNNLQQEIVGAFSKVLPIVPEEAHMDAKIALNERNVFFSVPLDSALFKLFINESFQQVGWWQIVIEPRPHKEPVVKIVSVDPPAPGSKVRGIGRGTYSPLTTMFTLATQTNLVKGHELFEPFRSVTATLIKQEPRGLVFELPKERKEPIKRGKFKDTDQEVVAPPEGVPETSSQEVVETMLAPAPVSSEHDNHHAKRTISLKQAIDACNAFKEKMGDHLEFRVTKAGKILALAEYGDVGSGE